MCTFAGFFRLTQVQELIHNYDRYADYDTGAANRDRCPKRDPFLVILNILQFYWRCSDVVTLCMPCLKLIVNVNGLVRYFFSGCIQAALFIVIISAISWKSDLSFRVFATTFHLISLCFFFESFILSLFVVRATLTGDGHTKQTFHLNFQIFIATKNEHHLMAKFNENTHSRTQITITAQWIIIIIIMLKIIMENDENGG